MKTLTNAPATGVAAAPNFVNIQEEILMMTVTTRNPSTGKISILLVGNEQKGMEALNISTMPTAKIESNVVETTAPVQTALEAPKRGRGRPRKNAAAPAAVIAPPAAEVQVATDTPKRGRGRPRKNAAAPAAATQAPAETTKGKGKPRQQGMATDIFNLSQFKGTLIHCSDKGTRTPVYIVEAKAKGCRVASPQKDQSGVAIGFVKCAVWFSVNAKQDQRSDSLNIAALFE